MTRRRHFWVWTLIVLASVIGFASILTIFVDRQMLDDNAWKNASEQVIQDPQVRDDLSVYLVNELYANVDVAAALAQRMPPGTEALAAPAAAALQGPATKAVAMMLSRPRVQALWVNASSRAHDRLVNVLENKTGHGISDGNGVVTLDLDQLVAEFATEVGIPQAAVARIPADTGQIVLMRSDQLSLAQNAVRAIRLLSVWLLVLVLGMFAAAMYIARGERRTTLRRIGWSFVLIGLLVLLVAKLGGNYALDALTKPEHRTSAHHVWLISTQILHQIAWATVLYGAFFILAAAIAGPTRAGRWVRRTIAPVLNERQGIAWSVAAFAYLLLVLWGGTHALRTWWGVLLLGSLLAAGVVALRRQTLEEAALGTNTGTPLDVQALVQKMRLQKQTPAEELQRLTELHDAGTLTDEEFERGKKLALGTI